MDSAVGLVQTYLRVNGYFTVVEYPVVELRGGFRTATDLDILAFRFPGSGRRIPGEGGAGRRRHPPFTSDPLLEVPHGEADMLIGEVKEVLRYLEAWMEEHWTVLGHTQLKDPVLSFLATLVKARGSTSAAGGVAAVAPSPLDLEESP